MYHYRIKWYYSKTHFVNLHSSFKCSKCVLNRVYAVAHYMCHFSSIFLTFGLFFLYLFPLSKARSDAEYMAGSEWERYKLYRNSYNLCVFFSQRVKRVLCKINHGKLQLALCHLLPDATTDRRMQHKELMAKIWRKRA